MKHKFSGNILFVLLGILGLGAILGGAVFIISPEGKLMGMPLSVLKWSPFSSFLYPGIILFLVLGVLPIVIMWALIKKPSCRLAEKLNFFADMHWSWSFSIYIAFILIIWIQLQMVFLRAVHWLHTFYMFYAIIIIFVALLPKVKTLYQVPPGDRKHSFPQKLADN